MGQEPPGLAEFKYEDGARAPLTPLRLTIAAASLALAAVAALVAIPLSVFLCVVGFVALLARNRRLSVGPRYLICGKDIIYYGNVTQVALDEAAGRLDLILANGKRFSLIREKFPTRARKPHKVAANQAAKFNKVTARVIDKVRRANPESFRA